MANFDPLTAEICWRVWGAPANFNGFWVLASLLQRCRSPRANQTLHDVWPSAGLVRYIYTFGGSCPLTEFCHVQNFTLRPSIAFSCITFWNERHIWRYEFHLPYLLNAATLPCESQNTQKCNITVGYCQIKLHQMYYIASSKWTCRLENLGCWAAMRVRNKDFVTSMTYENTWCKLGLTLNRMLSTLQLTISGATV